MLSAWLLTFATALPRARKQRVTGDQVVDTSRSRSIDYEVGRFDDGAKTNA
jgi:hypothetical protein